MHASIDAMAHYAHFGLSSVAQADHEERALLFPESQYGMSQDVYIFPIEQCLNNYWRLFHPTFPVVHRFSFIGLEISPLLYAAMIAIGAHYSDEFYLKQEALKLHDRCLLVLEKVSHTRMHKYHQLMKNRETSST